MSQLDREFTVCGTDGCGNVLGCVNVYGIEKICDKDCNKEQFFSCTFTVDMIQAGDTDGEITFKEDSECDYCPDQKIVIEDIGPIAALSS